VAYRSYQHGIERAIFHPSVEVHSGPWVARMGDLNHAGWKFEVEMGDYGREARVAARNPLSGMVGMFRTPAEVFKHQVSNNALYFPEQLILTGERGVFREMQIPRMEDMVRADVGTMIRMEPVAEFQILKPYADDEPQEIIVTPDKVPMLLEEIRKAQEPAARELLHRQNRRDGLQLMRQEAKILTFK